MQFSNPRLTAVIEDYPLGGNKRGQCTFSIEYKKGFGFRAVRQTTGKPKNNVYGGRAVIVDGDDGRTYILQKNISYHRVNIWQWDFMSAAPGYIASNIEPDYYKQLSDMIDSCYTLWG